VLLQWIVEGKLGWGLSADFFFVSGKPGNVNYIVNPAITSNLSGKGFNPLYYFQ